VSKGNTRKIGRALLAEYRPLLVYARRLTADGAEAADLVHTVMMRVLAQDDEGETLENVGAWLRTVLFRAFIDLRRRARRERIVCGSMMAESTPLSQMQSTVRLHATLQEAKKMISSLPAHYRVPYELYTFQHLSYEHIALQLGLPIKTVGTRINRARKRLRALAKKGVVAHESSRSRGARLGGRLSLSFTDI